MLLLRLDSLAFPRGLLCSMPKSDALNDVDGEKCNAPIDARGLHLYNCQVGTARFRPHRAILIRLAKLLKASGAHVDIERACPELFRTRAQADGSQPQIQEAILDVVALYSGSTKNFKVDVTIRSPFERSCPTGVSFEKGLCE